MDGQGSVRRPDAGQLDEACDALASLARAHGLADLRHGLDPGEVVADVARGRSYFDLVAFEAAVERRLGWRPDVVAASAPGARPGRPLGHGDDAA